MCFTKAGDLYWENFAEAAGLRAAADQNADFKPRNGAEITKRSRLNYFRHLAAARV